MGVKELKPLYKQIENYLECDIVQVDLEKLSGEELGVLGNKFNGEYLITR